MLQINVPQKELYDETNSSFIYVGGGTLELEHSLFSISLWEAKWHKPFMSEDAKTYEEVIDYIHFMTLNSGVSSDIYEGLTEENLDRIKKYIDDPMTATWFSKKDNSPVPKKVITSEVIYYQMISLNIPFECQYWHLNRLLTLIRVCSEKNAPKKKMSKSEILARNRALNEERKKRLNSRG